MTAEDSACRLQLLLLQMLGRQAMQQGTGPDSCSAYA
jgi:hypothetical protein